MVRPIRFTSVRLRVTALATTAVVVVLAAAAVGLVIVQRSQLTDNLDRALVQRANDLEIVVGRGDLPRSFGGADRQAFAQLVQGDGEVLVSSPMEATAPVLPPDIPTTEVIETRADLSVDDDVFRVLRRPVDLAGGPAVLVVGASLDEIIEGTGVLASSLAFAVPVMAAMLAALVWLVVGKTLAPVEAIRAEVADIGAGELSRRVPVPGVEDEVARLARTMNGMLERLDDASRRQRRFVADASHELRTPIARMRTEAEVDLARPGTAHLRTTLASVHDEVIALQKLIDDLLYLAKSDEQSVDTRLVPLDLEDIVFREAVAARQDGVAIDTSGVSPVMVRGDADQLRRVVRNLLDNAGRHARTSVAVALEQDNSGVRLTVDDDGPGIPEDSRRVVFDRFARLDDARSRRGGGTGLGLAIARDIVERHGGTIEIESSPTGGARLHIRFPSDGDLRSDLDL